MSKKNEAEKLVKRVAQGTLSPEKAAEKLGVSKKKIKKLVKAYRQDSVSAAPDELPFISGIMRIEHPIIANHLIAGRWVIPAAMILSQVLDTARSQGDSVCNHFAEVNFLRPAEVTGAYPIAATVASDGAFSFEGDGQQAAFGRLIQSKQKPPEIPETTGLKPKNISSFYNDIRPLGYAYGPDLRVVKAHLCDETQLVYDLKARYILPDEIELDPFLLDGVFHAMLHAADVEDHMRDEKVVFLPHKFKSLHLYRPLDKNKVRVFVSKPRRIKDGLTASLLVVDARDQPVLSIQDMTFCELTRELMSLAEGRAFHHGIHGYIPVWRPRPRVEDPAPPDTHVVIGADESLVNAVAEAHAKRGVRVVRVLPGSQFEYVSPTLFHLPFDKAAAWQKLMNLLSRGTEPAFDFLCHPGKEPIPNAALKHGFLFCKALVQSDYRRARVRLITHDAFKVTAQDLVAGHGLAGLAGLVRTLRHESLLDAAVLDLDTVKPKAVARLVCEEGPAGDDNLFAQRGDLAYVWSSAPCDLPEEAAPALKPGGVYVMAGGAGAIGRGLTLSLASRFKDLHFVWLGRSPLNTYCGEVAAAVRALGSRVSYFQTDIADEKAAAAAFERITKLGEVRGVMHLVGASEEALIASKPWKSFKRVYDGKVRGVAVLDRLTRHLPLDFFTAFASTIGVTGVAGMCDYSAANAALDSYGHHRETTGAPGRTIVIDWTLWYDGGMGLDDGVRAKFAKRSGVIQALDAFPFLDRIMAAPHAQVIVAGNDFYFQPKTADPSAPAPAVQQAPAQALSEPLGEVLGNLLSGILGVDRDELDSDTDIRELGADSVAMSDLSLKIEESLDVTFDATLLYEYQTINEIATHMADSDATELADRLGVDLSKVSASAAVASPVSSDPGMSARENGVTADIAIIGLSGRYPQCGDVESYWDALIHARDLVTEVPETHWDWRPVYGDPKESEHSRTISKWGGFVEDLRCFDPAFFRISPREAELMDPQQRLLMQEAWRTIENAGYRPSDLADSNTGVFIGITNDDYSNLLSQDHVKKQVYTATGTYPCIASNRISFFFGFHGPSLSMDTACASSLTAIHQAVVSITAGECPAALAGGVNLCFTPRRFMAFSQAGMLSADGRCKTFDSRANGYVRGEGVGLVMLKAAEQALADGDYIYAMIKGSSFNHGGLNTTITAPNPTAQADLIVGAMTAAGLDPSHISYMEAHGTGTGLGDPLEVRGLKKAYARLYDKWHKPAPQEPHIAVGAVKTNIGHLEAAAGIASITKVLLAMKYRYLPQNLHFQKQNPAIDLSGSPFYFLTEGRQWEAPLDQAGKPLPRRAGVSSFGFGGANTHVVLEDHNNLREAQTHAEQPLLFPLSARDDQGLPRLAAGLLEHLREAAAGRRLPQINLNDIAFTLQSGREALEHRLIIIAANLDELLHGLEQAAMGRFDAANMRFGRIKRKKKSASYTCDGAGMADLLVFAEHWGAGDAVDWSSLPMAGPAQRTPLPGYVFVREAYWLPDAPVGAAVVNNGVARLHPLISANTSDMNGLRFETRFSGSEFYLDQHRVSGAKVLPGTAYIELAYRAGELAGFDVGAVAQVFWSQPVTGNQPDPIAISLTAGNGNMAFEIDSGGTVVHARGVLEPAKTAQPQALDLPDLLSRCPVNVEIPGFYADLNDLGLMLEGGAFAVIRRLRVGEDEAFAELKLDSHYQDSDFVLHPALLDGALQTCYALFFKRNDYRLQVPFTIERISVFAAIPAGCLVHSVLSQEKAATSAYDVTITDLTGLPVVQISGFVPRPFQSGRQDRAVPKFQPQLLAARPTWTETPQGGELPAPADNQVVVLFDHSDFRWKTFKSHLGSAAVRLRAGSAYRPVSLATTEINPAAESDYRAFLEGLKELGKTPIRLVYLPPNALLPGLPFKNLGEQVFGALFLFLRAHAVVFGKQKLEVIAPYFDDNSIFAAACQALAGFAKSLAKERSNITILPLAEMSEPGSSAAWPGLVLSDLPAVSPRLRTSGERLQGLTWQFAQPDAGGLPLSEGDVVLITGGAGALGTALAMRLVHRYGASVILCGRSPMDAAKQALLDQMAQAGEPGGYEQFDITDADAAQDLVNTIHLRYGRLVGVFHLAAVHRDNRLEDKEPALAYEVLDPKIAGALNLDEACANLDLKLFVCYSSLAPVLGIAGQTDYCYANAFLDGFAQRRAALVDSGNRSGLSCSVNWPHWAAGGMQLEKQTEIWFADNLGLLPLETEAGLDLMEAGIAAGYTNLAVAYGDRPRIAASLGMESDSEKGTAPAPANGALDTDELLNQIRDMLCKILKIKTIDPLRDLGDYGAESIALGELTNRINKTFSLTITPVVFFEYATLADFIGYLAAEHGNELAAYLTPKPQEIETQPVPAEAPPPTPLSADGAVAIVGMAGVMPGSANLDAFWENLQAGRDLITEVPADRYDWRAYDGDPATEANRTASRWGGFMPDVQLFDYQFFGFNPREAQLMDPQQRLLLQLTWQAIEDAGHSADELAGSATGVFMGVSTFDYFDLMKNFQLDIEAHTSTGVVHSILANRISWFFNLSGPSFPIDTACSSSLVALHQAVEAMAAGSCDQALVGGVNLLLSPTITISFSKAGMLSPAGRCRTFDDRADGYVRGEGAGVVLLKRLDAALADGNPIHGVIRGSGVNHGGRAKSLTAPNPNAQADLIQKVHAQAGFTPDSVTYMEAHGTGTSLGDPIELNGLKKAFGARFRELGIQPQREAWCGVGSVKTNIGHLEAGAGMAGLFKLLLAMRHGELPATIHVEKQNPYIQLEDSPFYLVTKKQPWARLKDSAGAALPRRAGISSFGFGGANAHIALEEYLDNRPADEALNAPMPLVLSARDPLRLRAMALGLAEFFKRGMNPAEFASALHTLQVGRQAMAARLAVMVSHVGEAAEILADFAAGKPPANVWTAYLSDKILSREPITETDPSRCARAWVDGGVIDWSQLNKASRRLSLPVYPFAPTHCWLDLPPNMPPEGGVPKPRWTDQSLTLEHQPATEGSETAAVPTPIGSELDAFLHGFNQMEIHAAAWLSATLLEMGVFSAGRMAYPLAELEPAWLAPAKARFFQALPGLLVHAGIAAVKGELLELRAAPETFTTAAAVNRDTDLTQQFPMLRAHLQLLSACMRNLPDILYGRLAATDVMFPDASDHLVSGIYAGNPHADHINQLVGQRFAGGDALRILEVGAGTGGATGAVLEMLSPDAEYVYTDVSRHFLEKGRARFADAPLKLEFAPLDLERDPLEQGFQAHSFDVILASNVVHATKRVSCTLAGLAQLLKPQGRLILNELTQPQAFITLTFGLLDGWWAFDSNEQRCPNSPLLSVSNWQRVLSETGFGAISFYGDESSNKHFKQHVVEAVYASITKTKNEDSVRPDPAPAFAAKPTAQPRAVRVHIHHVVCDCLQAALRTSQPIPMDKPFAEQGIDSIFGVELVGRLNKALGLKLRPGVLFDHATPNRLVNHLNSAHGDSLELPAATGVDLVVEPQAAAQVLTLPTSQPEAPVHSVAPQMYSGCMGMRLHGPVNPVDARPEPMAPPQAKPGTLVIQVRAFSINQGDLLCLRGLYPTMPDYPFTPGMEVVGEVVAVGADVRGFKPGDAVVALTGSHFGGHASMAVADAYLTVHKPDKISFEEAVAFPVGFLIMNRALKLADVGAGDRVLIQSAAGGVGVIGVQLALALGAELFVTAGSDDKCAALRKLGAQHCINYLKQDFAAEIGRLTDGRGVDVVINTQAGEAMQKGLDLLAAEGRYVEIAMMALRKSGRLDLSRLVDNQAYFSIDLRRWMYANPKRARAELTAMRRIMAEGRIRPLVARSFSFEQLGEAYQWTAQRNNVGRVVVTVPQMQTSAAVKHPEVAVIGMAGRYPQAADLDQYWDNLIKGRDCVTQAPAQRWDRDLWFDPKPRTPGKTYCVHGGFLDDIDRFDARFFNLSGTEAARTDPQQRLFLETAWNALEASGYSGEKGLNCGVFVGVGSGDYHYRFLDRNAPPTAHVFSGNQASILAARIAYLLDLHGPALAIDTACSSSLVALHYAAESIRSGEAAMAVAGGVFVSVTANFHVLSSQMGMLSPQGRCAAFDAGADGFVPGEGVGAVVLKALDAALADGDMIHGIVAASGLNQDGATNGITAPSADSQTRLETSVYGKAGIDPAQIGMIESHGTGTALGDPIEVEALTRAFEPYHLRPGAVALGSAKTNIGHAATAAGIAGLTKVLLALSHRQIPPSLHFNRANPHIDFEQTPFFVPTQAMAWPEPERGARLAAVSSFGFSGTNCHVVLQEAPRVQSDRALDAGLHLIPLSARDTSDLAARAQQLSAMCGDVRLDDLAFTLSARRAHFESRLCLLVENVNQLLQDLRVFAAGGMPESAIPALSTEVDEARLERLVETWSEARGRHLESARELGGLYAGGMAIDWARCFRHSPARLIQLPGYPLRNTRYWIDEAGTVEIKAETSTPFTAAPQRLSEDLFYMRDHRLAGRAVLPGVAYLEFAAAAAQGQAINGFADVAWLRALYADSTPAVEVTAAGDFKVVCNGVVHASGRLVTQKLSKPAALPAFDVLERRMTQTISGDTFYADLTAAGYGYGPAMRPIQKLLRDETQAVGVLKLPAAAGGLGDFGLHPCLLDGALQTVVGLSGTQQPLAPYHVGGVELFAPLEAEMVAHATGRGNQFAVTLTDLSGAVILRFVDISARPLRRSTPDLIDQSCFVPRLNRLSQSAAVVEEGTGPVVIVYRLGMPPLQRSLAEQHAGRMVRLIKIGRRNRRLSPEEWEVAPGDAAGLHAVLDEIGDFELIYFLAALQCGEDMEDASMVEDHETRGIFMLFHLVQALGRRDLERPITFKAVSDQALDSDVVQPLSGSLPGFCRSVAREFHNLRFACVDVNLNGVTRHARKQLDAAAQQIAAEPADREGRLTVVRGSGRYEQILVPSVMEKTETPFRNGGTYLILGGHGGIGMVLARRLARDFKANIVLVGRRAEGEGPQDCVAELESLGGTAVYFQADAATPGAMAGVVTRVHERFGPINGAVHSAISLRDRLLEHMDLDTFRAALFPKTRATHGFCSALAEEPLDFMLVFSSLQSFIGGAGQSNYAAGCTFQDAFIHAHRERAAYPVKLLHWGYWGSVGVVAGDKYRQRMAELGLLSIEPDLGLAALERFLGSDWNELLVVRAERKLLDQIGVDWEHCALAHSPAKPSILKGELDVPGASGRLPVTVEQQVRALEEVNAWCAELAAPLLVGLKPDLNEGCEFDLSELTADRETKQRLIEALAAMAESAGRLQRLGDRFKLQAGPDFESLVQAGRELAERAPAVAAYVRLVLACAARLSDVVDGRTAGTEVLFPAGSSELVADIYRGNQIADFYNDLPADLVRELARAAVADHGTVRILEVGAGTGGSTRAMLERLEDLDIHYLFTDVSPALVARARKTFGADRPWMGFKVFDLEEPPPEGLELGTFDLIIAGNVLHAVSHVGQTLTGLQGLLKTSGCLVLNELTATHHFATLSFGLLDSWWGYKDGFRRLPHGPLLDEQGWSEILADSGFRNIRVLGPNGKRGRRQRILAAESSGVALIKPQSPAPQAPIENQGREVVPPEASDAALAMQAEVIAVMAPILELDPADLDVDSPHERFGVDSILAVDIVEKLNQTFAIELRATDFFNYACIRDLADHILALTPTKVMDQRADDAMDEDSLLELFRRLEAGELDVEEVNRLLAGRANEA